MECVQSLAIQWVFIYWILSCDGRILTPWIKNSLLSGSWMKIGSDMDGSVTGKKMRWILLQNTLTDLIVSIVSHTCVPHTGDQIRSQQGNIALISALLLTIQFTLMYQFTPEFWEMFVKSSYLCEFVLPEGGSKWIHEVLLCDMSASLSRPFVRHVLFPEYFRKEEQYSE